MPRSGGVYTLPPGYFATDGTTIDVSQHNPPFEDVAQALTDSLPRDGSAPMTGNLAMGSNKITGLAAGTNPADAVRFDQLPTFTPTTATLTAGTNAQGQGPITTDQVTITTAAANPSGATLPTAVAGDRVIIANRGANPVNIYPATGAAIGALATNAPVLLAVNQSVEFFARSATQWEGQISQPLDATLTSLSTLTLAAGDILYATAADTLVNLAKGTDGQYLSLASGVPAWAAPPGWTLVSSSSSWTGGKQTITGLGGYRRVMVALVLAAADAAAERILRVGGAGGILSTAIYLRNQGSALTRATLSYNNVTATQSSTIVIEEFNGTGPYKPIIGAPNRNDDTAVGVLTSSALTQIEVSNLTGNITSGTVYVWGRT